ncbi:MAG: hypothetical protein R3B09_06900 [Nannocystaceae bacterium]
MRALTFAGVFPVAARVLCGPRTAEARARLALGVTVVAGDVCGNNGWAPAPGEDERSCSCLIGE